MIYPFNTSTTAPMPTSKIIYVVVREYLGKHTPVYQNEDYIQAQGYALNSRKTDRSGCKYKVVMKERVVATKMEGKAIRANFR